MSRRTRSSLEADRVDHVVIVTAPARSVAVIPVAELAARLVTRWTPSVGVFEVDVPRRPAATPFGRPTQLARLDRRGRRSRWPPSMVGVARWLFDHGVAYAKERVQFDKPIGSFQARPVQARRHRRSTWSGPRRAVDYAAMAVDADDPTGTEPPRGQGGRRDGRDARRRRTASRSTAGSATRGSTTCTSTCGGRSPPSAGRPAWHHDRLADLLI